MFLGRQKWYVERKGDVCTISREDGLIRYQVPRSRLQNQIAPHGIVGSVFKDLCE